MYQASYFFTLCFVCACFFSTDANSLPETFYIWCNASLMRDYILRVASCQLRVASCQLRFGFFSYFASCELRVASCGLRVASWFSIMNSLYTFVLMLDSSQSLL